MNNNVKLTLKLNSSSILKAKQYVATKGISLSKLVENFFDSISFDSESSSEKNHTYSPLVQELAGIISLKEDYDYKSDYANYLKEKYE